MTTPSVVNRLLEDLEESLGAMGYIALYEFSWTLNGYDLNLAPEAVHGHCMSAFEMLQSRHDLTLVWTTWPGLDVRTVAQDSVVLNFDLDPSAPVNTPLLVLVDSASR